MSKLAPIMNLLKEKSTRIPGIFYKLECLTEFLSLKKKYVNRRIIRLFYVFYLRYYYFVVENLEKCSVQVQILHYVRIK